jgi:DNA invertase Pin-like site-specific DNA recombinase
LIGYFKETEIEFYSIQDKIDTSTPMGRFIFHLMGSLAEFERELIRERTNAGLKSARERGRHGGRPKGPSKKITENAEVIYELYNAKKLTVKQICKNQKISLNTMYKAIEYWKEKINKKDELE